SRRRPAAAGPVSNALTTTSKASESASPSSTSWRPSQMNIRSTSTGTTASTGPGSRTCSTRTTSAPCRSQARGLRSASSTQRAALRRGAGRRGWGPARVGLAKQVGARASGGWVPRRVRRVAQVDLYAGDRSVGGAQVLGGTLAGTGLGGGLPVLLVLGLAGGRT